MSTYWVVTIESHEKRYPIVQGPFIDGEAQKREVRNQRADGKEAFWLDVDCNGKPHLGRVLKIDGGKELA